MFVCCGGGEGVRNCVLRPFWCVGMLGWVFVKGWVVKRVCVVLYIVVVFCLGVT